MLCVTLWLGLLEQNRRILDLRQQLDHRLEQLVTIHDRDMSNKQMGLLQSQWRQLQGRFDANDQVLQALTDAKKSAMSLGQTTQIPKPVEDANASQGGQAKPDAQQASTQQPSAIPSPHHQWHWEG